MARVLITGSRSWTDRQTISSSLERAYQKFGPFTLVSGACPHGADRIAEEVADANGLEIERHPADWDRHGRRAGFVRNAEMVARGADICLAFIKGGSKGASMTASLAEAAGIATHRFTEEPR